MNQIAIKPEFEWAARLGYAARGTIYLIIGGLAVMSAFGEGGKTTGSKGALVTLFEGPFGRIIVGALVFGLLCYAGWRATQAMADTDNHGTDSKGIAIRGGLLVSAVTHCLLAIWAASSLLQLGGSSSGGGSSQGLLATGWGQWVVGIVGACVVGAGIAHLVKGWKAGFEKYMAIPAQHRKWARPLCRFGLVSRGVVYCIIGFFVASSAIFAGGNSKVNGMNDALGWLQGQAFGTFLLGITAIGLFAFGVYSLLESQYRRIEG